ncbi:hypothetical protein CIHG_00831 [Coccidioides immitis H538.4]|uniref:Uncharacterized protein n=3 Tax=Coccidioides immitis TaxID=5501 RepID=A0A0J8QL86_COCIT|nr:hypothetical protein CIRG_03249 [Coccidioides immitis RMSCC 2394]KMU73145.1 hypothetical protein CISG_03406 [Coccidioides immitis RMSCC 3703]KMU83049.1 hypothetical protein CIHG_00831 [Coccidioides immitis H538.4]
MIIIYVVAGQYRVQMLEVFPFGLLCISVSKRIVVTPKHVKEWGGKHGLYMCVVDSLHVGTYIHVQSMYARPAYQVWALAAMIMSRCCGGHRCRTFVRFLVPCPDFAGRVLVIGRGKEDDDVSEKYKARGIHRPTGIQEPHS